MKTAIITGYNGQDGSYLAELLLEKNYTVIGIMRRKSTSGDWRVKHLYNNKNLHVEYGDVTDSGSISRVLFKYQPDEFYNLAAQSFVKASWDEPINTMNVNAVGVTNCLEAIRHIKKDTRFYQASTSELFGKVRESPQTELTPFYPRSPYAAAKCAGYWITRNYRESYNMHASNGILFNHESSRRGTEFVTRKITKAAAKIKFSGGGSLGLGNLDSKRDWGHARDYMEAAHLMLQQDEPDDYVIATGKAHSIRDLLEVAFSAVGLNWQDYVYQDEEFMRPAEVDILLGDSSKARDKLGWAPKYTFEQLIHEMVSEDLKRHENASALR